MIVAPIPENEAHRLAALASYDILDTLPEDGIDDITRLAAAICGVPISLVSLVDRDRQWFKSKVGLSASETPRDSAFCAHTILNQEPLIVEDTLRDERFHDNPLVSGDPEIRFYAGAPLIVATGERIGTLCVIDREPRQLTSTQLEALRTLARQVVSFLELRRKSGQLERANDALKRATEHLTASEDRFRVLSDAAPVGIYLANRFGERFYTNPAWQKMSGLTLDESLGHGWLRAVHPDDRHRVLVEWNLAADEQREFASEFRFATRDGKERYIVSRATRVEGLPTDQEKWVGSITDITERRRVEVALQQSEEQLQLVLQGSSDGYWDWNVPTGEVHFSGRWASMLGYELGEIEPHVRSWERLVHPDDMPEVTRVLEEHFAGKRDQYETIHRVRTKSGEWKWILDRGKVVARDASGAPLRMAGTHSDVDERKHAEEMLDRFFNLGVDMLCVARTDGFFERLNPAFEEVLGYSDKELLSRPFLDLVHPDDRGRTSLELEKLARGQPTIRFENRYIRKDGAIRWIAWTASPVPESGLIYAAARDVTDARIAAQDLAESEERYRDLFENATDLIQAVNPEGKFVYVNQAWLRTLGYSAAEVSRLTLMDVIHPDSQAHCRDILDRVLCGERIPTMVTEFVTRDGEKRIVEGNVSCRFVDGQATSTRGIFRDVTESLAAERELLRSHEIVHASESAMRSIITNSLSGIVTFSREGLIASVNPAAEAILGYSETELLGRDISRLLPETPEDLEAFVRSAIHEGLGRVRDWELRRGDDRIVSVELALFEFETTEGKHLACNLHDISQRREVEKLKREFVATVSHELRTPLTSIRGSLDLLKGGVFGTLTPQAAEVTAIAHRNTTRLITLINDILDLDRIEGGKLEMNFAAADVQDLVRIAVDSIATFAAEKGIRIVTEAQSGSIHADADRLVQVLVNLLSNAIKFSSPGSEVRLSAARQGEHALFRIEDHGRGIPHEYLERIFDRFQQVDSSDSRSGSGSGLGLAICRAIVEQHKGSIDVTSEVAKGSTFTLRLPLEQTTARAPAIGVLSTSPESRQNLGATLRREGYEVISLETTEQVRTAIEHRSIALLIVERHEDGNWEDVRSRIRTLSGHHDIPVIVVAPAAVTGLWLDENTTVFIPDASESALLEAIRSCVTGEKVQADVVIVEDDDALLAVLRKQLERDGIAARTATSGREALAMIRTAQPRLIVLDIGLPDIDGFDVVAILRGDPALRTLPLLVYTGRYLDGDDRARLTLGPTRFMTKTTADDREFRRLVAELMRQQPEEVRK